MHRKRDKLLDEFEEKATFDEPKIKKKQKISQETKVEKVKESQKKVEEKGLKKHKKRRSPSSS